MDGVVEEEDAHPKDAENTLTRAKEPIPPRRSVDGGCTQREQWSVRIDAEGETRRTHRRSVTPPTTLRDELRQTVRYVRRSLRTLHVPEKPSLALLDDELEAEDAVLGEVLV